MKSAYGCADRERSATNAAAIFDIGSIAKTFTAAAVLLLAHNDKLKLSDTIADYYPTAPDALKPITIQQPLGHTSGLDNFHNDSDFELMNKAEGRINDESIVQMGGSTDYGYTALIQFIPNRDLLIALRI